MTSVRITNKFAYLPNDVIREIVSYTGTYKIRNGKYMRQIPKDDTRYAKLLTIPIINCFNNNLGYGGVYRTRSHVHLKKWFDDGLWIIYITVYAVYHADENQKHLDIVRHSFVVYNDNTEELRDVDYNYC